MIENISQFKGSGTIPLTYTDIGEGTVRKSNMPKGYRSAMAICSDFIIDNRERSLMWCYKYGYKVTMHDATNRSYSNDYYKTGIFDFGVYFDASNSTLLAQLNSNNFTLADPIIAQITAVRDGKVPTVMAYGLGIDTYKDNLYTRFLSGRNSRHCNDTRPIPLIGCRDAIDNDAMEYGKIVKSKLISRPTVNRFDYYKKLNTLSTTNQTALYGSGFDFQGNNDYLRKINKVYETNSIHITFGHLHWLYGEGFKDFLLTMDSAVFGKKIYKSQLVELMEYWFVRDSVDSVIFDPNTLNITINYSKKDATRPYSNITTPLWIDVNLKGTSLQGSPIQLNIPCEIIKKSADIYAIGFLLDFTLTSKSMIISAAANESGYSNQNMPIVSVNTTTKLVTSNQPIKYTLFSKTKAQKEESVIVEEFMHTLSSGPTIGVTINTSTKDYYLGFVNAYGISGVINF